ncbi:ribose-phosphate pyrophosphokinase [Candidatus Zinderia insecticola CARI]|uniref:Ribose-phosphate pyrophosphokinase n=1 Tax=Zinderia insecticola (strain CARI) TaxID=871271 RepID=E0TIN3_ZINIC|nr:ribose-phosphate pyrophosphokinase [Candidatus Zinderia insecticola CARI]
MNFKKNILFSGNSNIKLVNKIIKKLKIKLGKINVSKFLDGEIMIKIKESVRNKNVFIIQSICNPINDNLIEMIIMVDAIKRAYSKNIIGIIPYYGYSRQDRKIGYSRIPISAKLIASILEISGLNHVVILDLHSEQIQGFFNIPIENIYTYNIFYKNIKKKKLYNPIIVSPDVGSIKRSRKLSKKINCDLAIIDKYRIKNNLSNALNLIGNVINRDCIITDDIIDTGGTIINTVNMLKKNGALRIICYCTHGVLSNNAIEKINNSKLDELIITDTIPFKNNFKNKKIKQLSCYNLIINFIKKYNK